MKETTLKFINTTWGVIKHPVSLTLIGGSAGSIVTYMLGNTTRERELKKTKEELGESQKTLKTLNQKHEEIKETNQNLILTSVESDKYGTRTRFNLEDCRQNNKLLKFAFDNSYCFHRKQVFIDQLELEKELKIKENNKNLKNK